MHLRIKLLLERFKQKRFLTSFVVWPVLYGIYRLILWLAQGISEEVFFSWIVDSEQGSMNMVQSFVVDNPTIVIAVIPILGITGTFIWMYLDSRKEYQVAKLIMTLDEMHDEMKLLAKKQLKEKPYMNRKIVENASPVMMDRLGIIKLSNWDQWLKSARARIRSKIPKNPRRSRSWYLKALGEITLVQRELFNTRQWTIDDALLICNWLSEEGFGLQEKRKNSKKWQTLYKSLRPYLLDTKLRELIQKHINFSYIINNRVLMYTYSNKWPNSLYAKQLFSALVASFDEFELEKELFEITGDVSKRLTQIQRQKKKKEVLRSA